MKAIFDPVSGFRGRFPVNETDSYNGKRDSWIYQSWILRTICLNRGPTGLLM